MTKTLFSDLLPVGWSSTLDGMHLAYPVAFARSLVEQFLDWEVQESQPYWISDVELVFVLAGVGFALPIDTSAGRRLTPLFLTFLPSLPSLRF